MCRFVLFVAQRCVVKLSVLVLSCPVAAVNVTENVHSRFGSFHSDQQFLVSHMI